MEVLLTPPEPIVNMIQANSNRSNQRTSENILLNALGQMGISGPEDIMMFTAMQSGCSVIQPFLRTFERNHQSLSDTELYVRLFRAIERFYGAFCGKSERFRRIFSQHEAEMKDLHEQFIDCEGPPDENKNSTLRCIEAANIVKCYSETLRTEIDEITAKAFVCLLEAVMNASMPGPCKFTTSSVDLSFYSSSAHKSSEFTARFLFFMFIVVFIL
jgi:hypothetical protein